MSGRTSSKIVPFSGHSYGMAVDLDFSKLEKGLVERYLAQVNWSLKKTAEHFGISPHYLRTMLTGRFPTLIEAIYLTFKKGRSNKHYFVGVVEKPLPESFGNVRYEVHTAWGRRSPTVKPRTDLKHVAPNRMTAHSLMMDIVKSKEAKGYEVTSFSRLEATPPEWWDLDSVSEPKEEEKPALRRDDAPWAF